MRSLASPKGRSYIYAIDFVRAGTIIGVVMVHSVRFALAASAPLWGGLLQMFLQYGRESFMVVTGFVLAHQYLDRQPNWWSFWSRRYQAVLFPYLVWLALFVAMSYPLWPLIPWFKEYVRVLPTGNGHLYYLVLTMELYVVAPLFLALVAWGRRHPWTLASFAVIWELGSWTLAGYLGERSFAPQMLVITYTGYFLLGGLAAAHWSHVRTWAKAHAAMVSALVVAGLVLMAGVYGADWAWKHSLGFATNVFQPVSVVYSLIITLGLFTAGTWFEGARDRRPTWDVWVRRIGNASFGIYLVHPIFVHGWLDFTGPSALAINPWLNTLLTALVALSMSLLTISWLQGRARLAWLVGKPRTVVGRLRRVAAQSPKSSTLTG